MLAHFLDQEAGSFFYTSDTHEITITRPKTYYDGSVPSGTSVAVIDLLRLSKLTGADQYRDKAEQILRLFAPHFSKAPDQFANMICALDFCLSDVIEIAMVADTTTTDWRELLATIHHTFLPNSVTLLKDLGSDTTSPLFTSRELVDNKPAVYICRNFSCESPITDSTVLSNKLSEIAGKTIQ